MKIAKLEFAALFFVLGLFTSCRTTDHPNESSSKMAGCPTSWTVWYGSSNDGSKSTGEEYCSQSQCEDSVEIKNAKIQNKKESGYFCERHFETVEERCTFGFPEVCSDANKTLVGSNDFRYNCKTGALVSCPNCTGSGPGGKMFCNGKPVDGGGSGSGGGSNTSCAGIRDYCARNGVQVPSNSGKVPKAYYCSPSGQYTPCPAGCISNAAGSSDECY